jgi:hypothetical protein
LPRRIRFALAIVLATLFFACALGGSLWHWKAPAYFVRRLQQATGHRVTLGAVSFNRHFELVAHDVGILGSPPFEDQLLAHANRVVVRLHGQGGFWSPSEVIVEGLDVDYVATAAGDNLRVPPRRQDQAAISPAAMAGTISGTRPGTMPGPTPRIIVRDAHLRGRVALPHGPHLRFRVAQAELERSPAGKITALLHRSVVDAETWGSLRVVGLAAGIESGRILLTSDGGVSLDVPGGGPVLEDLTLQASQVGENADFQLRSGHDDPTRFFLSAKWTPRTATLSIEAQDVPLRALGALTASRTSTVGLTNAKGSLHGKMAIDRSAWRADFDVEGGLHTVDLLHPAVDSSPWRNQTGEFVLHGYLDLAGKRLAIESGEVKALAATLALKGWLEFSQRPRASLMLATPKNRLISCAALLLAAPAPVQQVLSGLDMDGNLGASLALAFDAANWEALKLDVQVDPVCTVKHEAQVIADLWPAMADASALAPRSKLPLGHAHPDFVPLARMPRHLPAAFLTSEDSKFFHHRGFDVDMIGHALAQDLETGSFGRGASTITQQLAKNLFLSNQRTLARKLEEAVLTWRLHKLLSKNRVLELYLNVIELGPGIHGVGQAADAYFGKDVSDLTPLESAHLAALAPNPHVLARRFRDGQVDEGWQQRLFDLLGMMKRRGRLSLAELSAARSSKLILRDLRQSGSSRTKY